MGVGISPLGFRNKCHPPRLFSKSCIMLTQHMRRLGRASFYANSSPISLHKCSISSKEHGSVLLLEPPLKGGCTSFPRPKSKGRAGDIFNALAPLCHLLALCTHIQSHFDSYHICFCCTFHRHLRLYP